MTQILLLSPFHSEEHKNDLYFGSMHHSFILGWVSSAIVIPSSLTKIICAYLGENKLFWKKSKEIMEDILFQFYIGPKESLKLYQSKIFWVSLYMVSTSRKHHYTITTHFQYNKEFKTLVLVYYLKESVVLAIKTCLNQQTFVESWSV